MPLLLAIAWRNLWRNPRRTALTASAVGFTVALLVFAMSLQYGSYDVMIDSGTGLLHGHLQVQHAEWQDAPRLRHRVPDGAAVVAALEGLDGISGVAPRAMTFALAARDEQSYGVQVVGVDPQREPGVSRIPDLVVEGRYLEPGGTGVIAGRGVVRNLGLVLGDDLVLLGSTPDGAMGVLAAPLVGVIDTAQPELDRVLVQTQLAAFQVAFDLGDSVHTVAGRMDRSVPLADLLARADAAIDQGEVLGWADLIPALQQAIRMDQLSNGIIYTILGVLVTFSIANTFFVMIFERTREFGTLMAVGAQPGFVVRLVLLETLMLCGLGVLGGLLVGAPLAWWTGQVGLDLGDDSGMQEMMATFQMPSRLYFDLQPIGLVTAPLLMLLVTQVAAGIACLRVWRMDLVSAVRDEL